MTDRELMQMALDALEEVEWTLKNMSAFKFYPKYYETTEALRARLAQPEPPCKTGSQCVGGKCERCAVREPLADKRLKIKLGSQYGSDLCGQWFYLTPADDNASKALIAHTGITAPPQREWQGLTDEEIGNVIEASQITLKNYCSEDKQTEYARTIESKLKEKNAPASPS